MNISTNYPLVLAMDTIISIIEITIMIVTAYSLIFAAFVNTLNVLLKNRKNVMINSAIISRLPDTRCDIFGSPEFGKTSESHTRI